MGENLNNNDHDLIITINANLATIMRQQNELMEKMDRRISALELRMNQSENKDSRDSEKFQSISAQMQQSLNNSNRISEAFTEISGIKEDVSELKKKSNMFDWLNFIFAGLTSLVAYVLGSNK